MTPFAVDIRYPGIYEEISVEEARKAVGIARKIKDFVLHKLPKDVIE